MYLTTAVISSVADNCTVLRKTKQNMWKSRLFCGKDRLMCLLEESNRKSETKMLGNITQAEEELETERAF